MKKHILEFIKRGLMVMGGGPIILTIVYLCLRQSGVATELPIETVVREILSVSLLAFIAAGITVIYQIDRLPPFYAALIHGGVLYLDYLLINLFNGWLRRDAIPLLIFTGCFLLGYLLIWLFISFTVRARAKRLNRALEEDFQETEE